MKKGHPGFDDAIYFYNAKVKQYILNGKTPNAYAYSYSALTIADIAAFGPVYEQAVKEAVMSICVNFAERMNGNEQKADTLAVGIYKRMGDKVSVFGLLHAFEMIEMQHPPLDIEMYGFDVAAITRALGRYRSHCQAQYMEAMRGEEDKTSIAANMAALGRALDTAPAGVKSAWDELMQRNEERSKEARQKPEGYSDTLEEGLERLINEVGIKPRLDPETITEFD